MNGSPGKVPLSGAQCATGTGTALPVIGTKEHNNKIIPLHPKADNRRLMEKPKG